jgi:hypothetical protein
LVDSAGTLTVDAASAATAAFDERRRTADRIFRGALIFNVALTAFWFVAIVSQRQIPFFQHYNVDRQTLTRVALGVLFFYVIWGFIWYAVKNLLLKFVVGFTKEERRLAFSSRMHAPFSVADFTSRYSERRIRIVDMIGRRGRFITLGTAGFYYLYGRVAAEPSPAFVTLSLADNLFDAVATSWVFLGFYYVNGFLAAAFYGPQSRVMDGVLARANCVLITTLWTAFKFVMVPIGAALAARFPPTQFAAIFALIWGSYMVNDTLSEVGGSLFGKQTIRVRGVGDVNRKSVAGTVSGFVGTLVFCVWIVVANDLPPAWLALAVVLAASNTVLELYSPRGTDDFVMATANALICLAFGIAISG